MSIFKKKNKKEIGYISAKTSRQISSFNRKLTKKLEKEREDAGKMILRELKNDPRSCGDHFYI